jgi:hypothetical protein
LYLELEFVTSGATGNSIAINKAVIAPATYWNGLAWTWWPPYHTSASATYVPLGATNSIAVANGNQGKFQTFFRKAYNIQLPTADVPSISDTLAGGT